MNVRRTMRGSGGDIGHRVMFPFKAYIVVSLGMGVLTGAFGPVGSVPSDVLAGLAYGYVGCVFIFGIGAFVARFRRHDREGARSALLWVAVGVLVALVIWPVAFPVPTK